ncbi:MAG TPA: tryptophan-rich sensory protein [Candidatus Izemoplasmatales bacterium]|nr:tryptophan-rich sensory protein [Candidatus Izemoplasmatales bacterium]
MGCPMLFLKIVSALTFIAMLLVNYLANALPIGGNTTGDISGKYNSLFTPSGFTFSIWGIIYLLLGIFVVLLFLEPNDTLTQNGSTILILFNAINVFNSLWLLSWHNDKILLSTLVMVGLLIALLAIVGLVSKTDGIAYASFSIYAGWVSVALIANITIWIVKSDFSIFMNHEYFWFYIILAVSFFIGLYMVIKERNFYYGAVFLWAYIGIASKFI